MKVLIIGAGSIGTRHAKILHELMAPQILVVEPDDCRRAAFVRAVSARPLASLNMALDERPDAALICSPTNLHVSHCLQALRANCHVLLEKPVSNNLQGLDLLVDEARARTRVVLVSCNFRFDPALSQVKDWIRSGLVGRVLTCRATYGQDLRQCRPNRDYRTVYASNSAMGGGVLLDSVHELDYLSWFFGRVESVSAMTSKLSDLEMNVEDSANVLLRFESGVHAVVQLDYFRPEYNRSCEVIGTEGIIQWSYSPKMLRYFCRRSGLWSTRSMNDNASGDTMYTQQLQHFLACITGRAKAAQSIDDAVQTLRVALSATQAAASGREVSIGLIERQAVQRGSAEALVVDHGPAAPHKVVTIIQARMNSTRLPGKVLSDIRGKPMLARVIERVRSAECVGEIVVATSAAAVDDPIVALCANLAVSCFRGSELDVLDRYYECAKRFGANVVVRITGDCPLIDPQLIDELIRLFHATDVDYASNRRYGSPQALYSYPDGLDVEVFTFDALQRAKSEAKSEYEREHVTPFIWGNVDSFRVLYTQGSREFHHRQWTVDYPEDLELVRNIYDRLGNAAFGLDQVVRLLEENPELATVNSHLVPNGDWRYATRKSLTGHWASDA